MIKDIEERWLGEKHNFLQVAAENGNIDVRQ